VITTETNAQASTTQSHDLAAPPAVLLREATLRRSRTDHVDFDEGVAVETSAGRMDLLTCTSCGAAVLADPGTWRHRLWHEATDAPEGGQ